ncbi:hypothetical protein BJ508DRAFT_160846 [Ascobolus immersus RN42]|uniref:Uncharacterized protein n=1 Tax=Ascobolus immersus RN42 TaxID=1160509 RepID=A0A3N4I015_ASCIM|nr:hypothetical protein BJ508DRAFT_160846 [Ascobolus immersus RN42]
MHCTGTRTMTIFSQTQYLLGPLSCPADISDLILPTNIPKRPTKPRSNSEIFPNMSTLASAYRVDRNPKSNPIFPCISSTFCSLYTTPTPVSLPERSTETYRYLSPVFPLAIITLNQQHLTLQPPSQQLFSQQHLHGATPPTLSQPSTLKLLMQRYNPQPNHNLQSPAYPPSHSPPAWFASCAIFAGRRDSIVSGSPQLMVLVGCR